MKGIGAGADDCDRNIVEAHVRHRAKVLQFDEDQEQLNELQTELLALLREARARRAARRAALRLREAITHGGDDAR